MSAVCLTHWARVPFPGGFCEILPEINSCSCVLEDTDFSITGTTVDQAEEGAYWSAPAKWKQTSSLSSLWSWVLLGPGRQKSIFYGNPLLHGRGFQLGIREIYAESWTWTVSVLPNVSHKGNTKGKGIDFLKMILHLWRALPFTQNVIL